MERAVVRVLVARAGDDAFEALDATLEVALDGVCDRFLGETGGVTITFFGLALDGRGFWAPADFPVARGLLGADRCR